MKFDATRWDDGQTLKQGLEVSLARVLAAAEKELAREWGYDNVSLTLVR